MAVTGDWKHGNGKVEKPNEKPMRYHSERFEIKLSFFGDNIDNYMHIISVELCPILLFVVKRS